MAIGIDDEPLKILPGYTDASPLTIPCVSCYTAVCPHSPSPCFSGWVPTLAKEEREQGLLKPVGVTCCTNTDSHPPQIHKGWLWEALWSTQTTLFKVTTAYLNLVWGAQSTRVNILYSNCTQMITPQWNQYIWWINQHWPRGTKCDFLGGLGKKRDFYPKPGSLMQYYFRRKEKAGRQHGNKMRQVPSGDKTKKVMAQNAQSQLQDRACISTQQSLLAMLLQNEHTKHLWSSQFTGYNWRNL